MRRALLLLATMALAILLAGGVAQAIINGEPDTGPNAHPYVGALVTESEGQLKPVCSGTLISPRVFLTAGHCTEVQIKEDLPTYVSFDPTYKPGSSEVILGIPHTHPDFCVTTKEVICAPILPGFPPEFPRYDVGVVVLNKPVVRMSTYGALPDAGLVDTIKEGQRLTVVGYGVREFDPGIGERYSGTVRLLNGNKLVSDMFVKTTDFEPLGGGGQGSCSGDSGSLLFLPDQETIVGVSSVGSPLCTEPAYYQRADLPRVLKWVRSFP